MTKILTPPVGQKDRSCLFGGRGAHSTALVHEDPSHSGPGEVSNLEEPESGTEQEPCPSPVRPWGCSGPQPETGSPRGSVGAELVAHVKNQQSSSAAPVTLQLPSGER